MLHAQTIHYMAFTTECYSTLKKLTLVYSQMGKHYAAYDATQEAISFLEHQHSIEDGLLLTKVKVLLEGIERELGGGC